MVLRCVISIRRSGAEHVTDIIASYEQARQAVEKLERHSVAPMPAAYEVWLGYVLGEPSALRLEIDSVVQAGGMVDAALTEAMYERHFSHLQLTSKVIETGTKLSSEMGSLVTSLQNAARETHIFHSSLRVAADQLESASDIGSVKGLVNSLTDEARHLSARNEQLESSLLTTTREIVQLRSALDAARAESLTDPLTGLANRKLFSETMRTRRREADELGYDLCLAIVDIDHFKRFNDTWGHQTGDQIIRFVSGTLTKNALPDFLVCRYGGEEFAIIMPRQSLTLAFGILEESRRAIEGKRLLRRSSREEIGPVTVSIGVAAYRRGEATSKLVARADAALYHSKRNGRNQTSTESQLRVDTKAA
jgi:diguanylate cyclase